MENRQNYLTDGVSNGVHVSGVPLTLYLEDKDDGQMKVSKLFLVNVVCYFFVSIFVFVTNIHNFCDKI